MVPNWIYWDGGIPSINDKRLCWAYKHINNIKDIQGGIKFFLRQEFQSSRIYSRMFLVILPFLSCMGTITFPRKILTLPQCVI